MGRRRKLASAILGLVVGLYLSQLVKRGGNVCEVVTTSKYFEDPMAQDTEEKLLFVGVMTAARYLETRAKAVYETWGGNVPGKIVFFSGETSRSARIPLVPLIGVDDTYPPQKKSFAMLKYMHDHYLERYEWFMRADDDVYVRTDKLEKLLRSVDSRKTWFIGQTGRGNSEEFGLLSLESDENFCMGGPGILLSRETLRKIGPHIEECLKNLYTTHEDVELGRCVRQQAGVSCTWSYEASDYNFKMQVILYHNQSGEAAFTGDLKQKEVHRAITLHPVKQAKYMYRLHKYVKGLTIQADKQESIRLHRDIAVSMNMLGHSIEHLADADLLDDVPLFEEPEGSDGYLGDPKILGIPNTLNRFKPRNLDEVLDWEFISKSLYSYKDSNPRRRLGSSIKEGLGDVVREVMETINLYSKQRGRVIDFKEIFYGYWRLDPVHGVDLILDLLMVYKKYRGHKMTVPVRRHAYIQQTFTGIEIREICVTSSDDSPDRPLPFHKQLIDTVISKIGENLPGMFSSNSSAKKLITFVLPISGRVNTLKRFLLHYEDTCILEQENTRLIVVLYRTQLEDFNNSVKLIESVKLRNKADVVIKIVDEVFSRGRALKHGVDITNVNDLLFFVDVDIVFDRNSLLRIRQNTLKTKSIYFPIVYSEYNPRYRNESDETGAWRQFGFGIVSLYASDYIHLGGINVSISGWGFEDVDFYDRAIKSDLKIVRAVDPGLIHIYHPVECEESLDTVQLSMCKGTEASTLGSLRALQNYLKRFKKN